MSASFYLCGLLHSRRLKPHLAPHADRCAMQQQLQPRQVSQASPSARQGPSRPPGTQQPQQLSRNAASLRRRRSAARGTKLLPGQSSLASQILAIVFLPGGTVERARLAALTSSKQDTRHAVASGVVVSLRSQEVQIAKKQQPLQQAAQHAKPEGVPFKFSSEQAACIAQKSVSVSAQQKTSGVDRGVQRTSETQQQPMQLCGQDAQAQHVQPGVAQTQPHQATAANTNKQRGLQSL